MAKIITKKDLDKVMNEEYIVNYSYNYSNDSYTPSKTLGVIDNIDLTFPIFYGSKEYGEKIIEILEIFGGINKFDWKGDIDSFVYCISKEGYGNSILCFSIGEFPSHTFDYLKRNGFVLNIKDFLKFYE